MGEFHDAVTTLLDAFTKGIAVIRRKKECLPSDSTQKTADRTLSKSLKKSRTDVKEAYSRDFERLGPRFADGDAEAHSSLSAILFRLNAGFVSIIERFTRGCSSPSDYKVLLNLSNSSRMEAIHTFAQLSQRLSRSSLSLVPAQKQTHKRKRSKSSSAENLKPRRSKSAPTLTISVTPQGLVRPKPRRKTSTESNKSSKSKSSIKVTEKQQPARIASPPLLTPPPVYSKKGKLEKRKSIMSFASDSTKLGEIPEHKWARQAVNGAFPTTTYYPLEPYQEPEKPRSRLRKLFRW